MSKSKLSLTIVFLCVFLMSTMPPSIYIVNAQEDTWTTLSPMPTPRIELGLVAVEGKIYAIGGYNGIYLNTNEMYDPQTNTWTTKAPMPTARSNFAIFVYENKIHVLSGSFWFQSFPMITNAYEVYDPQTDTWETKKGSGLSRSGFEANVIDEKVYLISGTDHYAKPWRNSDLHMAYNLTSEVWSEKKSIPTAVYRYSSAVVDNRIFVIGGYQIGLKEGGYDLNQIYTPENDSWSLGSPIPTSVSGAGCVATTGAFGPRRIYVIGGFETPLGHAGSRTNSNYAYDPSNDQWSIGALLPSNRSQFGLVEVDGELYAIGGYDGINYLSLNQKYTPIGYGTPDPNYTPPTPTPDPTYTPPTPTPIPTLTPTPTIEPTSTPTTSPESTDVEFPILIAVSIIIIVVGSIVILVYNKTKRRS